MYPLFDQKKQYLGVSEAGKGFARVVARLFLPGSLLFFLFDVTREIAPFLFILFLVLSLFFYWIAKRDEKNAKDEKRVSDTIMNFRIPWFLQSENNQYGLMDKTSPLYEEDDSDICLYCSTVSVTFVNGKKKLLIASYTEKKIDQIKLFCKKYSLEEYPLIVTYYKKSRVLERVDLAENVEYSDSFIKDFMKLREII